jgi:hypothetical protein
MLVPRKLAAGAAAIGGGFPVYLKFTRSLAAIAFAIINAARCRGVPEKGRL